MLAVEKGLDATNSAGSDVTDRMNGRLANALGSLEGSLGCGGSSILGLEAYFLRPVDRASGLTVLELAGEVGYSERAMFRHLKTMYARIGVKNRTEALLWASQRGLLGEEEGKSQ